MESYRLVQWWLRLECTAAATLGMERCRGRQGKNRLQFLSPENRSDPRRPIIIVCCFLSHPEALSPLAVRVRLDPFVEPKRVHHTGYEPDHKRDQDGHHFPFVHVRLCLGIAKKCTQYADNEKMTMPYKAVKR